MKPHLVVLLMVLSLDDGAAYARSDGPQVRETDTTARTPETGSCCWHATLSLANLFDGNVDHTLSPVRSYGVVPSAGVLYERPNGTGFAWGYEVAVHHYTGTSEWDRISHNLSSSFGYRVTKRLRLETGAEANWKGSPDDRELANTFGLSQRATYRVSTSTRLVAAAAYRFKQYSDDPATSGPSPYIGGKLDQRFPGGLRLTVGYRYQSRLSQATRDRYRRTVYSLAFAAPLGKSGNRMSVDLEVRPQQYQRLITVNGSSVPRADRRLIAEVAYVRPINERMEVRWICGLESRTSNDPSKRFTAPSVGMTMGYRLR